MNLTENSCCKTKTCAPLKSESAHILRPAVSTRDEEDGVRLSVALPGVRKEDLKLTVHDGLLSIEAKRSDTTQEIHYSLSLKLADRLVGGNVSAALEDGVLNARLPLKEEAKPKEIPIA